MVAVEVGGLIRLVALARVRSLSTPNPVLLDRASRAGSMAAIALIQLHSTELVVQCRRAIRQAGALGHAWVRCLRARVERVCAGPRAPGGLGQRRARLVVGDVRLARVGEQREDGGDALRRGGAASGDGNEKSGVRSGTSLNHTMRMGLLHQMVVDCARRKLAEFLSIEPIVEFRPECDYREDNVATAE